MAKVTIYLPDDLASKVKDAGVSVSPVCQRALEREVSTMTATKIADDEIAEATQRLIAEEADEVLEARAAGVDAADWALGWPNRPSYGVCGRW